MADDEGGREPKQDAHRHVSSSRPQRAIALAAEADVLHDKQRQRPERGHAQQRGRRHAQRPEQSQPGPRLHIRSAAQHGDFITPRA